MKKAIVLLMMLGAVVSACKKEEPNNLPKGLYADIETNKGHIIVMLEPEKAPLTTANFVSLAEGKNDFVSPDFKGKPFYDGLKWHRVIKDFMIQGGDPLGNGSGDAGYKFKDEFSPGLDFNKGGVLAMANNGPATNSSQFFITHLPTPWLQGKHTIFGHVFQGMEIVNSIEQNEDVRSIKIIRNGDAAKKFDAQQIFGDYFKIESARQKKQAAIDAESKRVYDSKYKTVKEQKVSYFNKLNETAKTTPSGLRFAVVSKGNGKKPAPGQMLYVHYSGFLADGTLFDSSDESVAREFGKLDPRRAEAGQYMPIPFESGRKDGMIPGMIEGLENLAYGDKAVLFIPAELAYGAQGAGDVIPPNADIIFEVQVFEKMPK